MQSHDRRLLLPVLLQLFNSEPHRSHCKESPEETRVAGGRWSVGGQADH
jgi:hypothetical protein